MLATLDSKRLIDRGEEIFSQVGSKGDDGVEVFGGMLRVEATEEVTMAWSGDVRTSSRT